MNVFYLRNVVILYLSRQVVLVDRTYTSCMVLARRPTWFFLDKIR